MAYPTSTEHHRLHPWTSIMAAPYACDPTGATDCVASIEQLKSDLSNSGTIHVPKGTFKIATNLTIPAGMTLVFEAGATFAISAGITLTINGAVRADPVQIFTGTGTVSWGSVQSFRYGIWTSGAGTVLPQVQASCTANNELARKKYVDDAVAAATTATGLATEVGVQNQSYVYAVDSVGTDSYAITVTPAISAYAAGQYFCFVAGTTNTGACTLSVSGKAATAIKKYAAGAKTDLADADITAAQIVTVIYDGTDFVLISPTTTTTPPPVQYTQPYAVLADQKGSGSGGGTFTSGAWRTRTLNTEVCDNDNIVSLAANVFTLQAGTYRIRASAPACSVDNHKIRLTNTSDTTYTYGTSETAASAHSEIQSRSWVSVELVLAAAKNFKIEHNCTTSNATVGMGYPCSFGVTEQYTTVEIWKVA